MLSFPLSKSAWFGATDLNGIGKNRRHPPPLWGRANLPTYAPHKPGGCYDLGQQRKQVVDSAKQTGGPKGSLSAKAQVDIWSTDATRARERFSYWRDAVCHAIFNISIEAPPDRFSARVAARSAGPLRFAITESSGYQSIRTRRDIESAPSDHYSVFAQVRGQSVIHQCGESVTFNPSDICISDGRYPLRADMNGAG